MVKSQAPVITLDGPSGSGKGIISRLLVRHLQWGLLDSGAMYRLLALLSLRRNINPNDQVVLAKLAQTLPVTMAATNDKTRYWLDQEDVTQQIRDESCSNRASQIAALPEVREVLLDRQRAFRQLPGLVADGRDMGTVIFPDAQLKIFLTASLRVRTERRRKQLREQGVDANLPNLYREMKLRDERDRKRAVSPLQPARDAIALDTSHFDVPEVLNKILILVENSNLL